MFALTLLGGLSLTADDGALPPAAVQRRRLALLAILALPGARGLSRETAQALLWPESSADRARHALDQLLYATRRDLGRDAVLTVGGDLRLNPAVVRVDAWAFTEAVRDQRWAEAAARYAGPLLQGAHLLEGVELDQWIETERGRLEQDYRRALELLADDAARRGDHAGAVHRWRQRAAADPLAAPGALALMRALAASGDRAGAIRHARIHQRLVRESLELEPDPVVEALARELAAPPVAPGAGAPSLAVARRPGEPREPAAPTVPPAPPEEVAVPTPRDRSPRRPLRLALAGAAVVVAVGSLARLPSLQPREVMAGAAAPAVARAAPDAATQALYLRGRTAWERRTRDGLQEAVVLFREAAERDPQYAAAWAGLAEAYAMLGYFGFAPGDAMFPKARAAARRALELDPRIGGAHAALGQALAADREWAEAERAYRRALELDPGNATVHQWYGLLLAYLGRSREAAEHTGHAARLDPLSVQVNNMHGMMLYYAGRLPEALRQYERTVDAEPDSAWVRQNPWVLTNFGRVAAAAGRHEQAAWLTARALDVEPVHPRPWLDMAHVHVRAGHPDSARAAFARADAAHPHHPVYQALLHGLLGELDAAFRGLERVDDWPLPALVQLNGDPGYARLRADPRYAALRARLRMPPR